MLCSLIILAVVSSSFAQRVELSGFPLEWDALRNLQKYLEEYESVGEDTIITSTINNLTDKIMANVDRLMAKQKFDPMAMPQIDKKIEYKMIITYSGEMELYDGVLTDTSTLHRNGDSIVTYNKNKKYLEVTVPLAFTDLAFSYKYKVNIMHIGPKGKMDGKVMDFRMQVKIGFDYNEYRMFMDGYQVIHSGDISVHFSGQVIYDWLINLMTKASMIACKLVIIQLVQIIVKNTLEHVVDMVNDIIRKIIG